jgi:AraC-like DNA-binding protein
LGLSAQSLRDRVMPLSPGAPEWTARLLGLLRTAACPEQAACIFEGFVAYRLQQAPPLDPLVQVAARQMIEAHGSVSVRSLALRSGLGERQFRRRFTPAVGLLPKEFARVRRLRWACVRMVLERQSLVDLAGQSGFADQAHLSREFVSVVGAAPASFAERLRRIELGRLDG